MLGLRSVAVVLVLYQMFLGARGLEQDFEKGIVDGVLDDEDYEDDEGVLTMPEQSSSSSLGNMLLGTNFPRFACAVCDDNCAETTYCYNAVRCYTYQVREVNGKIRKSKGCIRSFDTATLYCNTKAHDGKNVHEKYGASGQYSVLCCNHELCNNGTDWPALPDVPFTVDPDSDKNDGPEFSIEIILAIALPIVSLTLIGIIIIVVARHCHRKKMEALASTFGFYNFLDRPGAQVDELVALRPQPVGDSTLRELRNESNMTSGSGFGMPHLVLRTLAKEIQLTCRIGKGRYGEVWKATWKGEFVAVKIFFSRDEYSWQRETEIYKLVRNDNILGFVGSDCTSFNSCTQFWLVTDYYPLGSLYDYLNRDVPGLRAEQTLEILTSVIKGLLHLHDEINGTKGKPSIAHRDMKTKNILIRENGSCVIADFGLAVMHFDRDDRLDEHQNSRVGTKRYMSPEVLDMSIDNNKTIEAFRLVDIYAFSLITWEVLRRTRTFDDDGDSADPYALPFHNDVGPDPSFEEMRKVVCTDGRRPEFIDRWKNSKFTFSIWQLMCECWNERPRARLSTLNVKNRLVGMNNCENMTPETTEYNTSKFEGISRS